MRFHALFLIPVLSPLDIEGLFHQLVKRHAPQAHHCA
jgi:hypothetical protein